MITVGEAVKELLRLNQSAMLVVLHHKDPSYAHYANVIEQTDDGAFVTIDFMAEAFELPWEDEYVEPCVHCDGAPDECPGAGGNDERCTMTRQDWCDRNPDLAFEAIKQWRSEEDDRDPHLEKRLSDR